MADVTVSITSDSVGVQRAGFGKPLILSYNCPVDFTERTRTYDSLSGLADDFASSTVEYLCASQIFSQEPAPSEIMVGRGALPPTQKYALSVSTVAAGRVYALHVEGEGVTATDISYTPGADKAVDYADSGAIGIAVAAAAKTYTRATGSFVTDGFTEGMTVTVSGFANGGNNGVKTIATVSALVITMTVDTGLVDEASGGNEQIVGAVVNITYNHIKITGTAYAAGEGPVRLSTTGGLPAGTDGTTNYWLSPTEPGGNTYYLAASYAAALAGTPVTDITTSGTGVHSINFDTNDAIVARLVQDLNAVTGKNYTAAVVAGAGETDTLTVIGTTAGDWFSIEVLDPTSLESAQTHIDPGVATDLAAILVEDDSWYTLLTNYNSNAYALAAAGWCETAGLKTYACDLAETDAETTALLNSDTGDDLRTLNRARTATFYHRKPQEFFAASSMGKYLPYEPGEATLKFKSLSGVSAISYTATQRTRLEARQMNYYRSQRGVSMIANGQTVGGSLPNYFDVRRDVDWLQDDQEAGVFAVLAAAAKVPFTDEGISIVLKEVRASLDRAVQRGIITAGYVLTAPLAADVSDADKLNRILPDIKWTATLAGAVHGVTISGVVSV